MGNILHGLFRRSRALSMPTEAAVEPPAVRSVPEAIAAAPVAEIATEPLGDTFDPGVHTVAEVQAYLVEHPEDADRVLELERQGKARKSLVG